jgi:hypothetical protein
MSINLTQFIILADQGSVKNFRLFVIIFAVVLTEGKRLLKSSVCKIAAREILRCVIVVKSLSKLVRKHRKN